MTPEQLGIFILGVIALIPLVDAVRRWFGKPETRTIAPQPFEVKEAAEYMTLAGCKRFHEHQEAQFQRLISELHSEFRAVLQEELRKIEALHTTRTDDFRKEVHSSIGGVHRRVDLILEALRTGAHIRE